MRSKPSIVIAAISCVALVFGLSACGQSEADKAAEAARNEQRKEEALAELGATPLPSGLKSECTGTDSRLPSVALDTSGDYIGVEIPGNDQIEAANDYGYFITIKGSVTTQLGFKNVVSTGETYRYIYNMGNSKQKNYGSWDESTIQNGTFVTALPSNAIKGNVGTEWSAVLNIDGQEVASCPADGTAKFE